MISDEVREELLHEYLEVFLFPTDRSDGRRVRLEDANRLLGSRLSMLEESLQGDLDSIHAVQPILSAYETLIGTPEDVDDMSEAMGIPPEHVDVMATQLNPPFTSNPSQRVVEDNRDIEGPHTGIIPDVRLWLQRVLDNLHMAAGATIDSLCSAIRTRSTELRSITVELKDHVHDGFDVEHLLENVERLDEIVHFNRNRSIHLLRQFVILCNTAAAWFHIADQLEGN